MRCEVETVKLQLLTPFLKGRDDKLISAIELNHMQDTLDDTGTIR